MSIFVKQDRLDYWLGDKIYYGGDMEKIQRKVAQGANVDGTYKSDYQRRSMLYWAVHRQRQDIVEFLLSKGATPNHEMDAAAKDTALLHAVSQRNLEMVQVLLKAKADTEIRNGYGDTAVLAAARMGEATIVQALIEGGAKINAQAADGNTALHYAAMKGHANLARYLLDNGADIKLANANMNTPADVADSEFPRIAAMIRGENPDAVPAKPAPPPPAEEGWKLTAQQEVARIVERPAIGYRLTEIFNFEARLYTQLARNLETGAESRTVKGFSELDDGRAVEAAHNALVGLGGKASIGDKKKLQAPRQG